MSAQGRGGRAVVLGVAVALSAHAASGAARTAQPNAAGDHATQLGVPWAGSVGEYTEPVHRGGISCVPFARENSNIELTGNAATWWQHAAGVYARGNQPEVGSVLNFRATSHMRLGHVAVVTNILAPRVVEVDHANWSARGRISHGVRVVDVSPRNDWTQVRVALPASRDGYGSVYPTYGFIYDRADSGVMLAARGDAKQTEVAEVAELPEAAAPQHVHGTRHSRYHRYAGSHHRHWHRLASNS